MITICLLITAPTLFALPQDPDEVPVTIKELDVEGAITEFKNFQTKLGEFREEIGKGRSIAQETSQWRIQMILHVLPKFSWTLRIVLRIPVHQHKPGVWSFQDQVPLGSIDTSAAHN